MCPYYVRISKYKHIIEKSYTPNWTTELFKIAEVQKTVPVTYKLKDLNGVEIRDGLYTEEPSKTKFKDTHLVEKILPPGKCASKRKLSISELIIPTIFLLHLLT